MKNILYTLLIAVALLTSCNRVIIDGTVNDPTHPSENPVNSGSLSLALSCVSDYHDVETKATDDEIINDLSVNIYRPFDKWSVDYTPFSTIRGKVVELGSGDYILTAQSQAQEPAAYEQPIYKGTKDFKILTGQVTSVSVVCAISNAKVTINLSNNFVNELSGYTVSVNNGVGTLSWSKNADHNDFKQNQDGTFTSAKAGFFTVAPLTVVVDGHRAIDNTSASTTMFIETVNAADHHILNLDAQVTGQAGIDLSISHEVNKITTDVYVPGFTEDPVEGDDNTGSDDEDDNGEGGDEGGDEGDEGDDDPVVSTAPSVVWEANPSLGEMNIDANLDADLMIKAPEKIAVFKVTVDSKQLTAAIEGLTSDGTAVMDLINDEGLIGFLSDAAPGLPTGDALLGKTSVDFQLTSLLKLISMYKPANGDKHNFTLYVEDEKGQSYEQTMTFVSVSATE